MKVNVKLPPPKFAWLALGTAMGVAAAILLWESRSQTFFADEWAFFANYRGWSPETLLTPDSGNLVLVPSALQKTLIAIFGGGTYVPERVVWTALDLFSGAIFFLFARKRIGDWGALGPTILLLVFGAGGETLAGPLGTTVFLAVGSGLAALLLLDRRDTKGDIGAMLMLIVSLGSFTTGVAFLVGATVEIARRGKSDWRRAWVVIVPALLYGAWRVWAVKFHETQLTLDNILSLPSAIATSVAAGVASITGTFRPPGLDGVAAPPNFDTSTGWVLAVLALGLVVVRIREHKRWPINPRIWVYVVMALTFFALIGANLGPLRAPDANRYQYTAAIFLLLPVVELLAGVKLSWRGWGAIVLVLLAGLAANLANLHETGKYLRVNAQENQAELAALELVRAHVNPGLPVEPLSPTQIPTDDMVVTIGNYLSAADDLGSPAYALDSVRSMRNQVRQFADAEMVHALALGPVPLPRPLSVGSVAPGEELTAGATDSAIVSGTGLCRQIVPLLADAKANFTLPPGGFTVLPSAGPAPVLALRRFGDGFVATIPAAPTGAISIVRIPADAAPDPWYLGVTASVPVTICSL
jgi:hypothetical protein